MHIFTLQFISTDIVHIVKVSQTHHTHTQNQCSLRFMQCYKMGGGAKFELNTYPLTTLFIVQYTMTIKLQCHQMRINGNSRWSMIGYGPSQAFGTMLLHSSKPKNLCPCRYVFCFTISFLQWLSFTFIFIKFIFINDYMIYKLFVYICMPIWTVDIYLPQP